MGIMKGAMTVRRYRVAGEVPEDFRTTYVEAFHEHAFMPPASAAHKEEVVGWCRIQNLLETDFEVLNHWLMGQYIVAAMRVDKKVLPAKLFRAYLDQRCQEWCTEQGRDRIPSGTKSEIKDLLEQEMLAKTLPRVAVTEFCWNVVDGWVLLHNTSDKTNDRFRTLFRNTFGLVLEPFSPLEFLMAQPELSAELEAAASSDYRPQLSTEAR